jgi:CDP-diacylglycerol--serine O-phosphatidyltransferase
MRFQKAFIPSIFTILNMFSGFLAILQIFNGRYISAIILIIVAALFDSIDGKLARWLQESSHFGIEFDSLADLVSFGVAPAVLVNRLIFADMGIIGGFISFFPLLFGSVRLARYNLTATKKKRAFYIGLPIPASAVTICSYIWFHQRIFGTLGDPYILLTLVIVLSFLMVSTFRFNLTPEISFLAGWQKSLKSCLFILVLISMIIFPALIIFPAMSAFVITHILMWLVGYEELRVQLITRRRNRAEDF